jgi:hypothetical protein
MAGQLSQTEVAGVELARAVRDADDRGAVCLLLAEPFATEKGPVQEPVLPGIVEERSTDLGDPTL